MTPRGQAPRGLLVVLAVGAVDLGFEQSIVLPALPAVQEEYGTSLETAAWLVTVYLLVWVALAPLLARLGDLLGKRRLMVVALGLLAIGSLVSALADSTEVLLAGRAIQGAGAAVGPLGVALARDLVPRRAAAPVIGLLAALASAGYAVGLVAGGLLVDHFAVASIFWVLFAVACVTALSVALFAPESPVRAPSVRIDWLGAGLLATALASLLLGIAQGNTWGWTSARVIALFAVGVGCLAVLALVERARNEPVVDIGLMARRPVWGATVVALAVGMGFFVAGVVVPQLATLPEASFGFGLSATGAGLLLVPGAVAMLAGAWTSGKLVSLVGARRLVAAGALCSGGGYLWLALAHGTTASVAAGVFVQGLGLGLAVAAVLNLAAQAAPPDRTTVTVAVAAVARTAGAALGSQVAASIIVSAGVVGSFPAQSGFAWAFGMAAVASLAAVAVSIAIPSRSSDPTARRRPETGEDGVPLTAAALRGG